MVRLAANAIRFDFPGHDPGDELSLARLRRGRANEGRYVQQWITHQQPYPFDVGNILTAESAQEKLNGLVETTMALQETIGYLDERIKNLEETLEQVYQVVLGISQEYYWTEEWQEKERRADEDEVFGRFKAFTSAEELIKELNR